MDIKTFPYKICGSSAQSTQIFLILPNLGMEALVVLQQAHQAATEAGSPLRLPLLNSLKQEQFACSGNLNTQTSAGNQTPLHREAWAGKLELSVSFCGDHAPTQSVMKDPCTQKSITCDHSQDTQFPAWLRDYVVLTCFFISGRAG